MGETNGTDVAAEGRRIMTICNACRYCEGLCATFQAMTFRRQLTAGNLDYLANLCHNCTACYHGCQYAPPHEFDVNVPRTLADLRLDSYERHAWPAFLGRAFQRNGLLVSMVTAILLIAVLAVASAFVDRQSLYGAHSGAGAFYAVVPHAVMVAAAGATFAFSVLAICVSVYRFLQGTADESVPGREERAWVTALGRAGTLKYLDGGHGNGCSSRDDRPSNKRRFYHQLTMWGFLLCFAATIVASIYDYGFGLVAPYPVVSLPVILGVAGGIGLLAGPAGLFYEKIRSDRNATQPSHYGMDYAFMALLFLVSLSGLLLLAYRETTAMGMLLVAHLGFVLTLFVVLPYSKFVHGAYRLAALRRFAAESRARDSRLLE